MTDGRITTNDGLTLRYIDVGSGRPVVLIHGWQQAAELWRYQIDALSAFVRVIAFDHRGHGVSDKPAHGYKVHRLAKDLQDLMTELDLSDAVLVGHSMGCQVVLAYLELFGPQRVSKIALVDEPIFLTIDPAWDERTLAETGAVFPPQAVLDTVNGLANPATREQTVRGLIDLLTSPTISPEAKEWIVQWNLRVDGIHSGSLFYNHAHQDWREQVKRVQLPTLVVGAQGSPVPASAMRWAADQIPGAQLEIFAADEGGSHFMFIENPAKFNAIMAEFVK